MHRIAHGSKHYAAGVRVPEFHFTVRQGTVGNRLHHCQQVALQQGQHHLGLGIAETAVILDDLRSLLCQHQAEIEAAAEFPAFLLHGPDGRQEDRLHAFLRDLLRVEGIRSNSSHAAGVRAVVTVLRPLVVHTGNHGFHGCSVGESQNGNLRTFKVLLNNDLIAALPEFLIFHDLPHSRPGFPAGHGHGHALAQGKSVRLDHGRDRRGFQVFKGFFRIRKNLVRRGGNTIFLHQVLGENLAAFNDGRVGAGAEAGNAFRLQSVHASQHQRIIRSNNRVINLRVPGEGHNPFNIRRLNIHTGRVRGDTAVARQGINRFNSRILFQLFDDGMFTAAAADNKQVHS